MQNVELIIDELNLRYNVRIVIINQGQLEFALEKPKEKFNGVEMYPELYQKAAILMETMTKLHTLSDGNKRTAMLMAEFMIKANGGDMVLPLKATRLSVDVAMDADDGMRDEIQKWFKVHVAMNPYELSVMLKELIEEEEMIKNLLKSEKILQVRELLDKWLAFDNYPEYKKEWDELEEQWRQKDHYMSNSTENKKSDL